MKLCIVPFNIRQAGCHFFISLNPSDQLAWLKTHELKRVHYWSSAQQEPGDVRAHTQIWTQGTGVRHRRLPGRVGQTHHQETQRHRQGSAGQGRAERGTLAQRQKKKDTVVQLLLALQSRVWSATLSPQKTLHCTTAACFDVNYLKVSFLCV